MSKEFKLKGETTEEKLKHLDKVLPKIIRHTKQKVITERPSSFNSFFVPEGKNLMVRFFLFSGRIKKIGFDVEKVESEDGKDSEIDLSCYLVSGNLNRGFDILTKKTSYSMPLNMNTKDGDVFAIKNNKPTMALKNVSISILFIPESMERKQTLVPFVEKED